MFSLQFKDVSTAKYFVLLHQWSKHIPGLTHHSNVTRVVCSHQRSKANQFQLTQGKALRSKIMTDVMEMMVERGRSRGEPRESSLTRNCCSTSNPRLNLTGYISCSNHLYYSLKKSELLAVCMKDLTPLCVCVCVCVQRHMLIKIVCTDM